MPGLEAPSFLVEPGVAGRYMGAVVPEGPGEPGVLRLTLQTPFFNSIDADSNWQKQYEIAVWTIHK